MIIKSANRKKIMVFVTNSMIIFILLYNINNFWFIQLKLLKHKDTQIIIFVFVRKLIGRIRSETYNNSYDVGDSTYYGFKDGKCAYTSHCHKQSVKVKNSSSIKC
jgi:hypothetical protein